MASTPNIQLFGSESPWRYSLLLSLIPIYIACHVVYNLYFHPLRRFPGPLLNRMSKIPYSLMLVRGNSSHDIKAMHDRYGDIVRTAPNELSFSNVKAWQDIMGHKKLSQPESGKEMRYLVPTFEAPNIVFSDRDDHRRFRRILAHGFSNQALMDQEPLIMAYVEKLISRLHDKASSNSPVNAVSWYNFTTFDIIADLTFGESLGLLDGGDYHPLVAGLFGGFKFGSLMQIGRFYPALGRLVTQLMPKRLAAQRQAYKQFVSDKVDKRLSSGVNRPDFMETIAVHQGKEKAGMSEMEIYSNASLLMAAGSETTATTLSGATYLCLTNPRVFQKVKNEVRAAFNSNEEINMRSVNRLDYMLAMFEETMRLYPPVPTNVGRRVARGGDVICGEHIPGDTTVAIWQLACYRDEKFFKDATHFVPERWLDDPKYHDDVREMCQPFHFGPRACLGRNLAYAEMRVIFAKMVFNFEIELLPESRDWMDQKMFTIWEKSALMVKLSPRRGRESAVALA